MPVTLTTAELFRTAVLSGQLMRSLHGQPCLVVGIARSGTAVAAAFAEGSGADQTVAVVLPRPTSVGVGAKVRRAWGALAPRPLRKLYKALLFKSVVKVSDLTPAEESLPADELARLRKALPDAHSLSESEEPRWVAVVDDSIDSGRTASRVVRAIEELCPEVKVLMFALSSSLGRQVTRHQLTLVSGEVTDFAEGDLARLDRADLLGGPRDCAGHTPRGDRGHPPDRRLYLDLDGTLSADTFRDAAVNLAPVLAAHGRRRDARRFRFMRLIKKLRIIDHRRLQIVLDRGIRSLEEPARKDYMARVAQAMRDRARWALVAIGNAPGVECVIVTAALASYADAIRDAFGFPVLTGSGPGEDGRWVEVGSDKKIEAIREHCGDGYGQWLVVGDTRVDALTASHHLTVVSVPKWDSTGLTTILGLTSWWRGPGPLAPGQLLDGDSVMRRIVGEG